MANLFTFFLINIYGPNRDEPDWFQTLFNKVENITNGTEIWTGDWNVALSDNDIYNYSHLRNQHANSIINNFMKKTGLIDMWHTLNPDRKRFT